jgi:uncharacterized protein YqeY
LNAPLKDRVTADVKTALKAGDKDRVGALRLILAALKQFEIDHRTALDDATAVDVLTRMAKQRRESIAQFEAASRQDLVDKERFELDVITGYLPRQLTAEEIDNHVADAIAATGAGSMKDMGKVMARLNAELKGQADMGVVSARVKARLSA